MRKSGNHDPAVRYWQAAPWVTGIAAALILAIGVKEWRGRPSANVAFMPPPAVMESVRLAMIPKPAQVDSTLRPSERRMLKRVSAPPRVNAQPPMARARALATEASGAGASGANSSREKAQGELAKKDAPTDELASAKAAAPAMKSSLADFAERSRDDRLSPSCYRLEPALRLESAPFSGPAKAVAVREPVQIVRLDMASANRIRVVTSLSGQQIGTWTQEGDTVRMILRGVGARSIALTNRLTCPPPQP